MSLKRILVACDAGAAGRELLTRSDLELGWALTADEATAWMTEVHADVVLTREELADEVLDFVRTTKHPPSVVVLLEPDGWDRRSRYFDAGATALVQASNKSRIFEALSNLTGLAFASHARVPYRDVVEVTVGNNTLLLETTDISISGVGVAGMKAVPLGTRVTIAFVMADPPLRIEGVVVRGVDRHHDASAGVSFSDLDFRAAAGLEAIIDELLNELPAIPDPVSMTSDLAGTFTLDLVSHGGYRELLKESVNGSLSAPRLPRWLQRIESSLTDAERRVLASSGPAFASLAVDARIRIAEACVAGEGPSREDCCAILDLCRALAQDASAKAGDDLAQLPRIRASLLSGVYGAPPAAKPADPRRAVNG